MAGQGRYYPVLLFALASTGAAAMGIINISCSQILFLHGNDQWQAPLLTVIMLFAISPGTMLSSRNKYSLSWLILIVPELAFAVLPVFLFLLGQYMAVPRFLYPWIFSILVLVSGLLTGFHTANLCRLYRTLKPDPDHPLYLLGLLLLGAGMACFFFSWTIPVEGLKRTALWITGFKLFSALLLILSWKEYSRRAGP